MQNMPNQQNQARDRDVVDIGRGRRGWYPRWWILSALFINATAVVCYLCWWYIPCHAQDPNSFDIVGYVCDSVGHTSLPPWLQIGAIWLLFLLGWLVAYLFGMRPLERLDQRRGLVARFLRNISNFHGLRLVLVIYGGLTSLFILFLMLGRHLQPVPFALGVIIVFVGVCAFFYNPTPRRSSRERIGGTQQTWEDYVRQADSPVRLLHDLFFYGMVARFSRQNGQDQTQQFGQDQTQQNGQDQTQQFAVPLVPQDDTGPIPVLATVQNQPQVQPVVAQIPPDE